MKSAQSFKVLLKMHGYTDRAIREIWKWYDFSERKGAASF